MRRSPILSAVVWSTVSGAALLGCGDDAPSFADAAVDAPPAIDAPPADASRAVATYPAEVTAAITCGEAMPAAVDVTVMNTGPDALVITSATASEGFAVVTTTPVTIAPGASAALAVRPLAAVIGTDIGGTTRTGMLSFVTNEAGAPTRTVALAAAIDGANIVVRDSFEVGDPIDVFRMSSTSCPPGSQLFIHNVGNRPATLTSPTANGFGFGPFSPSEVVDPGDYVVQPIGVVTSGPCNGTASIRYQATGAICSEQPAVLTGVFMITGPTSCSCD